MRKVNIYGPGCKRCESAASLVDEAARATGVEVSIEKVTDPKSIAMAGVMSTPGIGVDGKLVHTGGLPNSEQVKSWLAE